MARTHWSLLRAADGARTFSLPDPPAHYPPDLEIEPVHMTLALRVDPIARTAVGTNTLRVRANQAGAAKLRLDAIDLLDVSTPTDGVTLTEHDEHLELRWAEPLAAGEERTVAVAYRVDRPTTGLLFQPYAGEDEDAAPFAVTDNETERARYWMPCVDLPAVRTTLRFELTTDAAYTVLANGREVSSDDHGDGTKTVTWELDAPCPSYLACFAIGPFVCAIDGSVDGVPCATYALPPFDEHHLRRAFGETRDMLAWMPERLGLAFPYPKYFQVAVPGINGAMENISLVTWDEMFLLDDDTAGEWGHTVSQINVHEMAHSYFGDAVVCRDFAHAWLKESWATYIEQCWLEHRHGEDEAAYDYLLAAEGYFDEADTAYVRPLVVREFHSSFELYDMHLYPGGAVRLHNLRKRLGDEAFWGGVSLYLNRYNGKTVETDHFRHAMEEASGRSLGRWFDQWIHGKGYPQLDVSWSYDADAKQGSLTVEQTQIDAQAGVGVFAFPLDVCVQHGDTWSTRTFDIERQKHTFVWPLETAPDAVRVDRERKVLHRLSFNPGDAMLRAQLRDATDVLGRIYAGRELCATGKRRNLEAVVDAWRREDFWGVRVQWVRALVDSDREDAIAALPSLLAEETYGPALFGTIAAVGSIRDERIEAALQAKLDGGLPPRAAGEALRQLGRQRTESSLERVMKESREPGFLGWRQGGAFRGLAEARKKAAVRRLAAALLPGGCDPRARRWAALAAGRAIGVLDEGRRRSDLIEHLLRRLDDPNPQVRLYAVRGLSLSKAPEAVDALSRYARTLSQQDRVYARQVASDLRAEQRKTASGADEEVEKLTKRLRELEAMVEKLQSRMEA